jgi:hypothetical protein
MSENHEKPEAAAVPPFGAGMVVQIDPASDGIFGGCYLTVTEVKVWGVMGYVSVPGKRGMVYYRSSFSSIRPVGYAVWVLDEEKRAALEKGE